MNNNYWKASGNLLAILVAAVPIIPPLQVTQTRRTIALFSTRRQTPCTWSAQRDSTAVCRKSSRYRWTVRRGPAVRPRNRAPPSTIKRAKCRRSRWETSSPAPPTTCTYTRATAKVAARRSTFAQPRWICPKGEQVSLQHRVSPRLPDIYYIYILGWQPSSCRFFKFQLFVCVIKCFWHNVLYRLREDVLFYWNLCFSFLFELTSVNFQIIKMECQVEKWAFSRISFFLLLIKVLSLLTRLSHSLRCFILMYRHHFSPVTIR